jgi:hypothetical protein
VRDRSIEGEIPRPREIAVFMGKLGIDGEVQESTRDRSIDGEVQESARDRGIDGEVQESARDPGIDGEVPRP